MAQIATARWVPSRKYVGKSYIDVINELTHFPQKIWLLSARAKTEYTSVSRQVA
jgi:hypothetical protein